MRRAAITLLMLFSLSFGSVANADNYNEGIDGDLSGSMAAPTSISLDPGSNTITATSVSGDVEYFTVSVPAGFQLSALTVVAYTSIDPVAFIGVQNGTTFTEPPVGTNVANLLGYTHFGTAHVGTDILDDIGAGAGSQMFTPPLGAGNYTFWAQQTGANASTYTLDLQLTPAPVGAPALSAGAALLLAMGLGLLLAAMHRRKAASVKVRA
jgi:hypothetical protein